MFALAISAALLAGGLRDVRLLVLPEEDATYTQLADPADRAEFERIFWARRDPDPATPANELQVAVARARARADALYTRSGLKGADTDCGQLLVLLGEPPEIAGREAQVHFDNAQAMLNTLVRGLEVFRAHREEVSRKHVKQVIELLSCASDDGSAAEPQVPFFWTVFA